MIRTAGRSYSQRRFSADTPSPTVISLTMKCAMTLTLLRPNFLAVAHSLEEMIHENLHCGDALDRFTRRQRPRLGPGRPCGRRHRGRGSAEARDTQSRAQ